jgi:hypothetical protein
MSLEGIREKTVYVSASSPKVKAKSYQRIGNRFFENVTKVQISWSDINK